jgi:hypothetical protein
MSFIMKKKLLTRLMVSALMVVLTQSAFATTYYSTSSAAMSATANWNTVRDASGTAPANFTTLGDLFIIQGTGGLSGAPHSMTLATTGLVMTGVTLEIEGGATLTNSAVSATPLALGATSTFKLDANSTYIHGGNGAFSSLFGGTEIMAATSNFIMNPTAALTGPSTVTCGSNFGNLSYIGVGSMQCNAVLPNIDGNLTVAVPTGTTGELRLSSSAGTIALTVKGNLNLIGGTTSTLSFGTGTTIGAINLEGNFTMTGGVLQTAGTGGASGAEKVYNINFSKGSGIQTFTKTGGTITAALSSFRRIIFTVNSGSTLDMGANALNCAGSSQVDFVAAAGSTLKLGDPAGIVAQGTTATTGNIQTSLTSIRSFSTAANYEYNGTAPQSTGNGLPATVNNLTINNAAGVTLSAATTVNGTLNLAAGTLTLGANTLTTNGTVTKTSGSIDAGVAPMIFGNTVALTLPAGVYTGAVNSLTMNGAGGITLSNPLTVTGALTLTNGNITIGTNELTLNGAVVGGNNNSHVVTNSSGVVKRLAITSGFFPVGPTSSAYNPITIANTASADFSVNVVLDAAPTRINDPLATLGRTWNITSLSSGADVTFGYNDADALSLCVPTNPMRLSHFVSVDGTWEDKGTATPSAGVGTDRQVTYTGISSYSPFLLGNATTVLSIDLQHFTAKTQGTTNVLNWATATERNNSSFDIQHSKNGTDFTTIGAVKGNGTKPTVSDYTFTDNAPTNGINYYRLRAIDSDGKATLSKSVAVANGKTTTGIVKLYPSVSDAVLTVETVSEGTTTLNVVDVTGKTVLTKTIKESGFSSTQIDVSGLSNGIYFLVFKSSATHKVQKFVKN